ncbi:MAG: ABC-F family ATP-binding cassette domain-containing protein [Planctomycetes bacterium]|nr:ABC-F family ATP-binding cassette domain-containing protein [Planctomycetota bacterium]
MTLVTLSHVTKRLGGRPVLIDIDWQISPGERVGLVGANGAGKTTLLEVIAGELGPDAGEIARARTVSIGVHRQRVALPPGKCVREAAEEAFSRFHEMEAELRRLEEAMAAGSGDAVVRRHGELLAEFERRGGYRYASDLDRVLAGLGFGASSHAQPVDTLSGGERVRLGLARLLLSGADLLLLDEPTNHLDLAAIRWLEEFLVEGPNRAVVLVSHDRALLDRVPRKIAFLESGRLRVFRGAWREALEGKRLTDDHAATRAARIDEEIARNEEFIRRNFYGQRAKQANSREKLVERLRAERPELVRAEERRLALDLSQVGRLGNDCLELTGVALQVEGRTLLAGLDLVLSPGDRLGVLGPNGSGKTTLLRTIAGERTPDAGEVSLGKTVSTGFHRQEPADLDGARTVLAAVEERAPRDWTPGVCRAWLARFGFTGEEAFRELAVLSGGERSRLALARLLLSNANLLLLDEPTNHLDIPGREALEEALASFPGALVVVSHDRVFLDRVATRLLVLDGRGGFRSFQGGYTANRAAIEESEGAPGTRIQDRGMRHLPPASEKVERSAPPRKVRRRYTYKELEARIFTLEEEKEGIEAAVGFEENYKDARKLARLDRRLKEILAELPDLYAEWESWA